MRAGHGQRQRRVAAGGDRVGRLLLTEAQGPRGAGRDGIGEDARMIEPFRHDRQHARQATLDLIGGGERREEVAPAAIGVLGGGEDRAEVIARMTGA